VFGIVKTSQLPYVVIWSALNRLLNKIRHNLHHIGYLAYLLQRLTWRPTIALLTFDLTYHTCNVELIVINSTWLLPARNSEVYRGLQTLGIIFINLTRHSKAETILIDQGVPKLFYSTRDWLQVPLNGIVAIVSLTRQSHSSNCRIQSLQHSLNECGKK